jgi:hypothetical protein
VVNDHDFRSDAIGVAIPHGVYDLLANRGCVTVGVSHDTPAFAARAIARWWHHDGGVRYRRARSLLLLGDTGGSNGYRCRAWKTELQAQLVNAFGLTVTVAHYPTGASKWNPIAHRLFSEISKNWAGEPLDSLPEDPPVYPFHPHADRACGHRAPGSAPLSDRHGAHTTATPGSSRPSR